MAYQVGEVIVFKKESPGVPITAIIVEINKHSEKETFIHVCTRNEKYYQTKQKSIISLGNVQSIITDNVISSAIDPKHLITAFLKSVLFHLIRATDKYNLQILSKCNYQLSSTSVYNTDDIQEILNLLYTKIRDTSVISG